ncbi:MAG: hypothetical protein KDJ67_05785 [Nitratireductor sp.]|nr:hypothetical protein [Nitratireductor sp.]MCB1456000.1 hypothetical protein [Nitratireductor sp.]
MALILIAVLAAILVFGRKPMFAQGAAGKTVYYTTALLLVVMGLTIAVERIEGMGEAL